jgi:hypothetical protein
VWQLPDAETRSEVMDIIEQVQPHLRAGLLRAGLLAGPRDVQQRRGWNSQRSAQSGYFAVLHMRVSA